MKQVLGEERRIQAFGGVPEGKRPLGRPRRRWNYNIKLDLHEVVWGHRLDRSD